MYDPPVDLSFKDLTSVTGNTFCPVLDTYTIFHMEFRDYHGDDDIFYINAVIKLIYMKLNCILIAL